jgi:hypothetical protein
MHPRPSPALTPRHTTRALASEIMALGLRARDALSLMTPARAHATAARLRLVVSLLCARDAADGPTIRRLLDDVRADLDALSPAPAPTP